MNLYIPEIGDQLKLIKDWKFALHAESRNIELGALFGYYFNHFCGWVKESEVPKIRDIDYEVDYPDRKLYSYDEYNRQCELAKKNCSKYVQYQKDCDIWREQCSKVGKETIDIVLPTGTMIKVDRIYIRKGVSDYSSLTFFASGLGSVVVKPAYSWGKARKKSALRFWAKLIDCNNIEFEKHN